MLQTMPHLNDDKTQQKAGEKQKTIENVWKNNVKQWNGKTELRHDLRKNLFTLVVVNVVAVLAMIVVAASVVVEQIVYST